MTPSEVRALKRCRLARVLDALAHGQLPATRRNTKGGKLGWFIRAADAARWNPDHQVLRASTITKPPPRSDTEELLIPIAVFVLQPCSGSRATMRGYVQAPPRLVESWHHRPSDRY